MATSSTTSIAVTSVTLTSTDLGNLPSTPITLLPAPGAGLMYNVLSVDWVYIFGTTAYNNGGGNYYVTHAIPPLSNSNNEPYWATASAGTLLMGSASYRIAGTSNYGSQGNPEGLLSTFENLAVILGEKSTDTGITGGDGTLTLVLVYTVEEV